MGNLGLAYDNLGRVDEALACHQEELRIAQEIGDRISEVYQYWVLGLSYKALGDVEQAQAHLERAAALFEEVKSPKAEDVRRALAELRR
jgi:tetratricopeptide (TPR) repeat protein